jgi:hypothetical protein
MPACSSEQGGSHRRGGALAPQTSGEIKMTVKPFELKTLIREEWLAMDKQTLEDQLEMLDKEYPLVLHTDAGRTFSTVRRMKTEKTMGLPIHLRTGFAISVATGKAANEMTEDEWEEFYYALSERLNRDYPDLYKSLFSPNENGKGILDAAELNVELKGPRAAEILNEFAGNHSSALSLPGANIGAWTNYLDVSQNIKDRDAAVNAGKAQNQIAIWDMKLGQRTAKRRVPTGKRR